MNNPFRIPGEVPVYPKEETKEERDARLQRESIRRNIKGVLSVTSFPSASLMAIGFLWQTMTTAEAATSLLAASIMSIGVFFATGINLEWFKD